MRMRTTIVVLLGCVACGGADDDGGASSGDGGTSSATAATATSAATTMTSTTVSSSASDASASVTGDPTTEPGSSGVASVDSSGTDGGSTGAETQSVVFAVIGDFGNDSSAAGEVAALVDSWDPAFVITLGDNNYPDGEAETIDENIGQYYAQYIGNYQGTYGAGAAENRFWPATGNHDWHDPQLQPYLDYFTLPGNERYYEVDLGLVHLFSIDSDDAEPDGTTADSAQAQWLQEALAASTACWKLVYFHHAAYSSSDHGSNEDLQWPYEEWGADAVLAGHDHTYERLAVGGIPYFVNGLGGAGTYEFPDVVPESIVRYNESHGAMSVSASSTDITFEFTNVAGEVIDTHTVEKDCGG